MFVSFLLFVQGFWSSDLSKEFRLEINALSGVSAYLVGQIAAILYFWPVTVVVGSIFITAAIYIFLGLGQSYIEDRLFRQTVKDKTILIERKKALELIASGEKNIEIDCFFVL